MISYYSEENPELSSSPVFMTRVTSVTFYVSFTFPTQGLLLLLLFAFVLSVCLFFKTVFLSIIVLAVLELAFIDQAGLELNEILLSLPPKC